MIWVRTPDLAEVLFRQCTRGRRNNVSSVKIRLVEWGSDRWAIVNHVFIVIAVFRAGEFSRGVPEL